VRGEKGLGGYLLGNSPDHPHVRGEKKLSGNRWLCPVGSSPRAWGKVGQLKHMRRTGRIIPTCVGKSVRMFGRASVPTDHPHVRGEKARPVIIHRLFCGSSPRAWGKVRPCEIIRVTVWIIPTCVGKRNQYCHATHHGTDHPHVRGEKSGCVSRAV